MLQRANSWQPSHALFLQIVYNVPMEQKRFFFVEQQSLRITMILWVAYFSILGLSDWWFVDRDSDVLLYYAVQTLCGIFILGWTLLPWRRFWSESTMLPVVLTLMAILPSLTVHVMLRIAPSELLRSPEGMTLRLTPALLIGLLLTARYYRWPHVVLFSLGVTVLNLAGIFILPIFAGVAPRANPEAVLITGIQTISLLMVGYVTNVLISRLREQQRSLEEANAQLRDYASTQVELTISRERNRMARELHDTLAHTLSGLSVQLEMIKAYWDIEPTTAQEELDEALAATRAGLKETRNALKALRATPLDDLGLALAIRQQAEVAAARANLDLQLSITEPLPPLAPEVTHCLYRVAQEAITNVVYHANAKTLSVTMHVNGDGTQLTVTDDGIGFEPNKEYSNHWGVEGIRERAQLVGGELLIESQVDCGTTVNLHIPEKPIREKSITGKSI